MIPESPGTATGTQADDGPGRRPRKIRWAAVALIIHNWLGLKLFLLLAIVFLSGTLAVYRYEIDWLLYPQMRVEPGPSLAGLDAIAAALEQAYPDWGFGAEIPTGEGAGNLAIGVLGISPTDGLRLIWVDPYRAIVQGDTSLMTPGAFFAKLHRDLFATDWGLFLVCATAIVLLISLITGLVAYRRFWLGFLRRPRFRTLRIAMVDLHKLVGLWSLWFAIVICLTGLWYFWTLVGEPMFGFPRAMEVRATHVMSDSRATARLAALGPDVPKKISLDDAHRRALMAYPDLVSTYVSLPEKQGDPYVFHGNRGEFLALNATAVAVDTFSGKILGARLTGDAPVLSRIGYMINPLHYGDFGGMISKTIWFLFGLALSSLIVTGIVIYWCRTIRTARGLFPTLFHAFHPWHGAMGWLKPFNWAVLVVAAIATMLTARYYAGGIADAPARFPAQAIGPWQLGVTLIADLGDIDAPLVPGKGAVAAIQYCQGCWDEIRHVWVEIGPRPPKGTGAASPVEGRRGFAFGRVNVPSRVDATQYLWLMAEGWDRRLHRVSWPLAMPEN